MSCHCASSAAGDIRVMVCGSAPRGGRAGPSSEMRRPVTSRLRGRISRHPRPRAARPRGLRASARLRPADRDRERGRRLGAGQPQLAGDPVALYAVVEARLDDEEVAGDPAARDRRPAGRRAVRAGTHRARPRPRGAAPARSRRAGRAGLHRPAQLPLAEPREHAGDDEAQGQHGEPARPHHDFAQGRREDLGPRRRPGRSARSLSLSRRSRRDAVSRSLSDGSSGSVIRRCRARPRPRRAGTP